MRDYFEEMGFIDVETPMLGRSTPEGARDYLVPSRIQQGCFYALPQSPQLYKQIMMVAGYDRYVQVARCFRDEDLRADRQPEFTQLDLEMSFVDADDIMGMIDGLMVRLGQEILGLELALPLPRMTLRRGDGAVRPRRAGPAVRHGDRRLHGLGRRVASSASSRRRWRSGRPRARHQRQGGRRRSTRAKCIDELTAYVKHDFGAKGLAWFRVEDDGKLWSPIAKNFSRILLARLAERMGAEPGDLLLFVADELEITCKALYGLRKRLGAELKLYDPKQMHFSWVVEFPMFEYDEEQQRWAPCTIRSPRRAPQDCAMLETDPGRCRAQAYDLVINGSEAGGGTIRIHDPQHPAAGVRAAGDRRARRPASGSASCWTPCSTAPRPTAASPWASTAW